MRGWGVVKNGWCAYVFHLYALVICDHAPAQRNVEDIDFVSAVPHSNHHNVGIASWQNHDSSPPPPPPPPPPPQSVILLHCHVCRGLSTPIFPPHCGGNVKVKTQHIYQAMDIPVLLRGWGEAVVTNDWCNIYSLKCTSHENLALSHPQNYIDPKHKMSQCMRFPTIRYVRPAKPQISLRKRSLIRAFESRLSIL